MAETTSPLGVATLVRVSVPILACPRGDNVLPLVLLGGYTVIFINRLEPVTGLRELVICACSEFIVL